MNTYILKDYLDDEVCALITTDLPVEEVEGIIQDEVKRYDDYDMFTLEEVFGKHGIGIHWLDSNYDEVVYW